jgi:phosphatidylserine/phosphatidylglycerophosphate/cardiolipin synthase-like enzyme/V8-like Glu-specific endopeptidase
MDERAARQEHLEARRRHNEEFLRRLYARRPGARAAHAALEPGLTARPEGPGDVVSESLPDEGVSRGALLETIVREERPVLFVQDDWINRTEVTLRGVEAQELVDALDAQRDRFGPLLPLVGRIDAANFPGTEYVGTAWFVAPDIAVTNRHVASLIARWDGRKYGWSRGVAGKEIGAALCTAHEFDDLAPDQARVFPVTEVLYIEPDAGPHDIAFIRVRRRTDGTKLDGIPIAPADIGGEAPVFVVGYPARAPRSVIPDQQLMRDLYRDRYDVKRAAPGYSMSPERGSTRHDCTTLGGNSGSVVLDLKSGVAVGLHFAGLYQESNYAVPATVLADYVRRKRWNQPPVIETSRSRRETPRPFPAPAAPPSRASAADRTATITIPLTITVSIGPPAAAVAGGPTAGASPDESAASLAAAEAAVKDFWDQRPDGVVAVRVGFADDGEAIGDAPFIAAAVPGDRLAAVQAAGPARFQGLEVRYLPAEAAEQIDAWPGLESVDSIEYDDAARRGAGFSFATVEETMSVRAHVGPEYSWDELQSFLAGARRSLVSAMYEFHGSHIADALEARLAEGVSLKLVLDSATFTAVRDRTEEFERADRFRAWERFGHRFQRIVPPEGLAGLISDAYHIKVTVREDDAFWLSSGNWKMGSSQPKVTQADRDAAADTDLPGNREWHVVVRSRTLAARLRNHIEQDFRRSAELGGGVLPRGRESAEIFVDVPIEEGVELERRPPGRVLAPRAFQGRIAVKPLLTPDREGAVYSEAVLDLIRSARETLLFQIPYIAMPSNPRARRGFIDDLIAALAQKLRGLPDARLILRSGGSRYSSPTHTAWYLKSRGVDIAARVRQLENHHTKGMIVDGARVLIGSHNWSKPGVTLNRDASLIFRDARIAAYYAEAFEIDWERANPIRPRRFVPEGALLEAVGDAPPPGYRRVRLADLLKDDD